MGVFKYVFAKSSQDNDIKAWAVFNTEEDLKEEIIRNVKLMVSHYGENATWGFKGKEDPGLGMESGFFFGFYINEEKLVYKYFYGRDMYVEEDYLEGKWVYTKTYNLGSFDCGVCDTVEEAERLIRNLIGVNLEGTNYYDENSKGYEDVWGITRYGYSALIGFLNDMDGNKLNIRADLM